MRDKIRVMKVMKFGGASIGQPERMHHVAKLISRSEQPAIVVLSALSGTTSMLNEISHGLEHNERSSAKKGVEALKTFYNNFIETLLETDEGRQNALNTIEEHYQLLNILVNVSYSPVLRKDILAQGEIISSKLFSAYLTEAGIEHRLLPAIAFMQLNAYNEPLVGNIRVRLMQLLNEHKAAKLFITQGNICLNSKGEIDSLRHGGSDHTAALVAAAINAEVCEIWTDIEGMQNSDAALVEATNAVEQLSFEEAAELAYFGAKMLHPASVWPAGHYDIPVKVLNILKPEAAGTSIAKGATAKGVKAIAARDGITAIRIQSSRMLLAYGFIKKVFDVFEKHHTPVDMVTTSEVAISLTIDNTKHLKKILFELEQVGTVEVEEEQTIVVIVGNDICADSAISKKVFEAIDDIPIRMFSYGGSRNNISLLVNAQHKQQMLQALNKGLFGL